MQPTCSRHLLWGGPWAKAQIMSLLWISSWSLGEYFLLLIEEFLNKGFHRFKKRGWGLWWDGYSKHREKYVQIFYSSLLQRVSGCSLKEQHQQYLGACYKCKFLDPTPLLWNQNWGRDHLKVILEFAKVWEALSQIPKSFLYSLLENDHPKREAIWFKLPWKKIFFSRGNTPTFSSISFAANYALALYWRATNSKRKNSIVLKIASDLSASCSDFSIFLFTFASLVSVLFLKFFYPLVSRNYIFWLLVLFYFSR